MDSIRENYASPLVRKSSAQSLYRNKLSSASLNNSMLNTSINTSSTTTTNNVMNNNSLILNSSSFSNKKPPQQIITPTTNSNHINCHPVSLVQKPPTVSIQLAPSFDNKKDIKISLSPSHHQINKSSIGIMQQQDNPSKLLNNNKDNSLHASRLYSDILESSLQSIYQYSQEDNPPTIASSISGLDYIKDLYSNNNSFVMEDSSHLNNSINVEQKEEEYTSNNNNNSNTNSDTNSSLLLETIKQDINGVDELILFSPLSSMNETTCFDIDLSNESENELFDSLSYLTSYKNINQLNLTNCQIKINSLSIPFKEIKFIKILNLSNNGLTCNDIKCLCENLKQTSTLQELILSNNLISNKGVVSIGKYLTEKNNLKKLHLNNNKFTALGCKALCYGMMLNTNLIYLNLSNNNLQNCHFIISQLLQYAKCLKSIELNECDLCSHDYYFSFNNSININILNLEGNNLGDFITKKLFSSLTVNTSIHTIYLKNNGITDECTNTINLCLKNNSKLLYLDLSQNKLNTRSIFLINETCKIFKKNIVILTKDQLASQEETNEQEEEEGEEETQSNYSYADSGRTELLQLQNQYSSIQSNRENKVQVIEEEMTSPESISVTDVANPSDMISEQGGEYESSYPYLDMLTNVPHIGVKLPMHYNNNEMEYLNEEENLCDGSVLIECEEEYEDDEEEEEHFFNEDDIVGTFLSNLNLSNKTNHLIGSVLEENEEQEEEDSEQIQDSSINTMENSTLDNNSFLTATNGTVTTDNDHINTSSLSSTTTTGRREMLHSLSKLRDQYISPLKKPLQNSTSSSPMNLSFSQLMKQLNY